LIRKTSWLAAWASIFIVNLKVILLNKPHEDKLWYPESEVIRKADSEYRPPSFATDIASKQSLGDTFQDSIATLSRAERDALESCIAKQSWSNANPSRRGGGW
jgi:hypothetical protein